MVAETFLMGFDIRQGRDAPNPSLSAFFLRPDPDMAQFLGVEQDRDILLLVSTAKELQARIFSVLDGVLDDHRARLDPVLSILVGADPRTKSRVQTVLRQERDRAPIVALSAAEAQRIPDRAALQSVFAQQFFTRDLFAQESPLRYDEQFFGREELRALLWDRCRSGQNTGIFGLRRIGKTSLLFYLNRRVRHDGLGIATYLDLSSPDRYQARWYALLQKISMSLADSLKLRPALRERLHCHAAVYQANDGSELFRQDLNLMRNSFKGRSFVILLDEIENVTFDISPAVHWREDFLPFWQTLRSIHQESEGRFCIVIAGVNPHILETSHIGRHDNPLFGTVLDRPVLPFDASTVRQMVQKLSGWMGLSCEPELYERLWFEYGGHPFLVRQACSHLASLVSSRPAILKVELFEAERERLSSLLDKNVRQVLSVLNMWYPDEYDLIKDLAHGRKSEFLEYAAATPEFVKHVQYYGLVRDLDDNPRISMEVVANHLKTAAQEDERLAGRSPEWETTIAEISRRRNQIELRLRNLMMEGLRFAHGNRAASITLGCLPQQRRDILTQYAYREVWQELYFSELIEILKKQWAVFQNRFAEDRDVVLRYLDQVNRARADAHAKVLAEEDIKYTFVCFRRLDMMLEIE
jgi:hypothetical protein